MMASSTLFWQGAEERIPSKFMKVIAPTKTAASEGEGNRECTTRGWSPPPKRIQKRLQQVIQKHRPAHQKSQVKIQCFSDVGVSRARGRERAAMRP